MRSVFIVVLVLCVGISTIGKPKKTKKSLKDCSIFPIGAAIVTGNSVDGYPCDGLENSEWYKSFICKHFNSITAQNGMKMKAIRPNEKEYNFEKADRAVEFAEENNLRLHGHALVWHVSEPKWMKEYNEDSLKLSQLLEDHVRTVVSRYKGKVKSWDVVNEAIQDGKAELRDNSWYNTLGIDVIDKAFRLTKEVDPDVVTFYNEYGLVRDSLKMVGTLKLLDELKEKGTPVDGVGLQSHYYFDTFDLGRFEYLLKELVERGYMVHISELDINVNPKDKTKTKYGVFTTELEEQQSEMAYDIVRTYMEIVPEHLRYGITNWGISDKYTWARTHQKRLEWPLLFDDNYQPKKVFYRLIDAMSNTK